jgi:hypothetical protein
MHNQHTLVIFFKEAQMRVNRLSVLLLVVVSIFAASAALAEAQPPTVGCRVGGEVTLDQIMESDLMTLAAPAGKADKPSGSLLFSADKSTVACDWYWIDCGWDGIDDWCCGSFNSCDAYCSELCGGGCEYVPNES